LSNGIFGKHKYISDRAELVVDSLKRTTPFMLKRELRYLSVVIGQEEVTASSCFFINKGKGIYRGFLMNLENIKESTKDGIIQSFMENAKFARRGASHQRPKSWSKGTKSGSSKRKMREEGKREAKQMNEEASDAEKDARLSGYKNAREAEADNWGMSTPVEDIRKEHGVDPSHVDGHGVPDVQLLRFGVMTRNPKFSQYVAAITAHHEKGLANTTGRQQNIHKTALENLGVLNANLQKMAGDLSESLYARLHKRLAENKEGMEAPFPNFDAGSYELEGDRLAKIDPSEQDKSPKPSHADVIEMLNRAHENALAHIATAYSPGGKHKKLDPYYMLGHYMERLEDMHDPIREKLM